MKVFITGVSSGIGWGLAKRYLSEGHEVFGISRRIPEDLNQEKNFHHAICDIENLPESSKVIQGLLNGNETLDLCILNAGILGPISDMKDQSIENLKKVMEINVWANKPIIDTLIQTIPKIEKIVAISSGAAVNGNKGWGGYSISKTALNMMIKLYAAENDQINFYAFAPGLVDTAMQDYLCSGSLDTASFPSAQKLIEARNTPNMPSPLEAGKILSKAIAKLHEYPSGSFVDVRKM